MALQQTWICSFIWVLPGVFFFFWLCHLTHEILVPRLGIKPTPMHWECGVLITGQPRELPLGLLLTAVWCGYDEPLQIHGLSGW